MSPSWIRPSKFSFLPSTHLQSATPRPTLMQEIDLIHAQAPIKRLFHINDNTLSPIGFFPPPFYFDPRVALTAEREKVFCHDVCPFRFLQNESYHQNLSGNFPISVPSASSISYVFRSRGQTNVFYLLFLDNTQLSLLRVYNILLITWIILFSEV